MQEELLPDDLLGDLVEAAVEECHGTKERP